MPEPTVSYGHGLTCTCSDFAWNRYIANRRLSGEPSCKHIDAVQQRLRRDRLVRILIDTDPRWRHAAWVMQARHREAKLRGRAQA